MTGNDKQPLLEVEGLKKAYQKGGNTIQVVDGASFSVGHAEMVSVVGKSGAGKSTLLHLLGGLDKPTAGDVTFEGTSLAELNRTRWRNERVGFEGDVTVNRTFWGLKWNAALEASYLEVVGTGR